MDPSPFHLPDDAHSLIREARQVGREVGRGPALETTQSVEQIHPDLLAIFAKPQPANPSA